MFGQKKEKDAPMKSVYDDRNIDTQPEIDIDSIPVHTMKSDLEELTSETPRKKTTDIPKKKTEPIRQETSFLNEKKAEKIPFQANPLPEKKIEPQKSPEPKEEASSQDASFKYSPENSFQKMREAEKNRSLSDISPEDMGMETEEKGILGKIFSFVIFLCIIGAIGGGAYYFWKTRIENMSSANLNRLDSSKGQNQDTTNNSPENTPLDFSLNSANYLSIDPATLDGDSFKETILENAEKIAASQEEGPVEFIITDKSNTPMAFSDFSQKIGLAFPQSILSQLNETFSVYIYIDTNNPRVGLNISSKNDPLLAAAVSNEEKSLAKDLEPIFTESSYTLQENYTFSTSTYNNSTIHYTNIISPVDLSIDYTVSNSQLVIGTTKQTLRSILDYLAQKGTSAE